MQFIELTATIRQIITSYQGGKHFKMTPITFLSV